VQQEAAGPKSYALTGKWNVPPMTKATQPTLLQAQWRSSNIEPS
jgi:hypothetical protein